MEALLRHLQELPGVGERTALRLLLHMLKSGQGSMISLAKALEDVALHVKECLSCCMLTTEEALCAICSSGARQETHLCVVSSVQDLMAIEATLEYRGHYHVLHGTLSPMDGVGPSELRILALMERLQRMKMLDEVILATPPTIEGEATALYLLEQLQPFGFPVTRIASGVPVGGDLQFADRLTLSKALSLRRNWKP